MMMLISSRRYPMFMMRWMASSASAGVFTSPDTTLIMPALLSCCFVMRDRVSTDCATDRMACCGPATACRRSIARGAATGPSGRILLHRRERPYGPRRRHIVAILRERALPFGRRHARRMIRGLARYLPITAEDGATLLHTGSNGGERHEQGSDSGRLERVQGPREASLRRADGRRLHAGGRLAGQAHRHHREAVRRREGEDHREAERHERL